MKTPSHYLVITALAMTPFCLAEENAGKKAEPVSAVSVTVPAAMSVNELVSRTVGDNPELAYYLAEIDAAKGKREVAGRRPDPELGVQIGQRSLRAGQGGGGGDGVAWSVSVSQRFDFTGRNSLRKAIADRQVERAEAGVEQFRRELSS